MLCATIFTFAIFPVGMLVCLATDLTHTICVAPIMGTSHATNATCAICPLVVLALVTAIAANAVVEVMIVGQAASAALAILVCPAMGASSITYGTSTIAPVMDANCAANGTLAFVPGGVIVGNATAITLTIAPGFMVMGNATIGTVAIVPCATVFTSHHNFNVAV